MKKLITNQDQFGQSIADQLFFAKEEGHKTFIGGCCTMFMYVVMLVFVIIYTVPIITQEQPYYSQIKNILGFEGEEELAEIRLNETFNIFFSIQDAQASYQLDPTKVDIYISYIVDKDPGDPALDETRYEVRPCTLEQDFKNGTDMQEQLAFNQMSGMFYIYCIDQKEKILLDNDFTFPQGFKHQMRSALIKVKRCTNTTKNGNKCSSPEEIDEWCLNKQLIIRVLDHSLDQSSSKDQTFTYRQINKFPAIDISGPSFTLGEFQITKNYFYRQDNYFIENDTELFFTEYKFASNEVYTKKKIKSKEELKRLGAKTNGYMFHPDLNQEYIASIRISCSLEQVQYVRSIQNFWDWLANMAGYPTLLTIIFALVLDDFVYEHHSNCVVEELLGEHKQESSRHKIYDEISNYTQSTCCGIFYYLSCCCCKILRLEGNEKPSRENEKKKETMKQMLNIKSLIYKITRLLWFQDSILKKLQMSGPKDDFQIFLKWYEQNAKVKFKPEPKVQLKPEPKTPQFKFESKVQSPKRKSRFQSSERKSRQQQLQIQIPSYFELPEINIEDQYTGRSGYDSRRESNTGRAFINRRQIKL